MDESTSIDIQEEADALENECQNIEIQPESSGDKNFEEVQIEEDASFENGQQIENGQQNTELVNDMTRMLNNMEPPLSADRCIYRVPYKLRERNEESYTPEIVSIGPFHRGNSRLQTMEKEKVRCLHNFLERPGINLVDLVSTIKQMEGRIRGCYGETIQLNSNDFVKMILLDVSFILEKFWEVWADDLRQSIHHSLMKDFILLENQIPFFVIDRLYVPVSPSLIQLTLRFFWGFNFQDFDSISIGEIKHFTDLLRNFHRPPPERQNTVRFVVKPLHSASQLHDAGVKFKVSSSNCLLDLKFTNGVLEIPCISLEDKTQTLARNLLAFEQCHFFIEAFITDYYVILDFLINTTRDVDLLCDKEIIFNGLGDSSAAMSMVNNLNKDIFVLDMSYDYERLINALNEFCANPWHRWKAILRLEYFSTPWRTASTMAAVIFLVLTVIQTVCSIIQVVPKHK